ncbi:MAG TPA: TetR/AcrR family transcriptional regulator [Patescibacteria group bacterium]|nr:TetR/AcrR family transcriptional regulator [Patescibacteria group bacterium]
MQNSKKYRGVRVRPMQDRGKKRVQLILRAAMKLLQERGFVRVTTNDIAQAAGIPIGSLYRYFPNKDALLIAIIELYIDDISALIADAARRPLFNEFGWHEVVLVCTNTWVDYILTYGPFDFLYTVRANPPLGEETHKMNDRVYQAFAATLRVRCPDLTFMQTTVAFRLVWAATELGSDVGFGRHEGIEPQAYYALVETAAEYLDKVAPLA